jgi:hypothetical protein
MFKKGNDIVPFTSFIVDQNGNVCNPKVENGVSNDLNKEALHLVMGSSGRWGAKVVKCSAVNCRVRLPIRF